MAVAGFAELAEGFFEIAGIERPVLTRHEHGSVSFPVSTRDVVITAMQFSQAPDRMVLIVELGDLPTDIAVDGWRRLLDLNLVIVGGEPVAFSRHPRTGRVLLQCEHRLGDLTAVEFYEAVEDVADLAIAWRKDCFLGQPLWEGFGDGAHALQAFHPVEWDEQSQTRDGSELQPIDGTRFDAFVASLFRLLGMPRPRPVVFGADRGAALQFEFEGRASWVFHAPSVDPDRMVVLVSVGTPAQEVEPFLLPLMLDANFASVGQRQNPTYCRNTATRELYLHYSASLEETNPPELLLRLRELDASFHRLLVSLKTSGGAQPTPAQPAVQSAGA